MKQLSENLSEDSFKVMNELFGMTEDQFANLDTECSFVSPSFLRERKKREILKQPKNPITVTQIIGDDSLTQTIYEIGESEVGNFASLGKGYGSNVAHVFSLALKHSENIWEEVIGYRIYKDKMCDELSEGVKAIGKNKEYVAVEFFGLK